ncbi:MAG: hypothetical protein ABIG44_17675 [Planctomycetota bacterium]
MLVTALRCYYKDKGQFPKILAELVPNYIEHIPPPTWGNDEWDYEADPSGEGFGLEASIGQRRYPSRTFCGDSTSGEWHVDQ